MCAGLIADMSYATAKPATEDQRAMIAAWACAPEDTAEPMTCIARIAHGCERIATQVPEAWVEEQVPASRQGKRSNNDDRRH